MEPLNGCVDLDKGAGPGICITLINTVGLAFICQ